MNSTIPNKFVLLVGFSYYVYAIVTGAPISEVLNHTLAGICALFIGVVLFAQRAIGAGVAKLGAALVIWFGFEQGAVFILLTAVFALTGSFLLSYIIRLQHKELPYAPFLLMGTIGTVFIYDQPVIGFL